MNSDLPLTIKTAPSEVVSSSGEAGRPLQQDGVLVLDKPGGMTSAACIAKIRRGLGQKKIGHAGTLDPMAGGVLLVLLGQATKISGYLLGAGEKIYSGMIRLGVVTDTWDVEGRVLEARPVGDMDADAVAFAMAALVGTYEQEVPAYSAAKHQGRPLYALARKGIATPLKKKTVTVLRGEAELVGLDRVRFRVTCGSGTYIRSLAHSLGRRLGCGAALEELTREHSHPFGLEDASSLEEVLSDPRGFPARVRGIADALPHWPRLCLSGEEEARVRNGMPLRYSPSALSGTPFAPGMRVLMLDTEGKCLAIAETALHGRMEVWSIARGLWNP